jgi:hypothetical protein
MQHLDDNECRLVVSLIVETIKNRRGGTQEMALRALLRRLGGVVPAEKLRFAPHGVDSYRQGYESLDEEDNPYVDAPSCFDFHAWNAGRADRDASTATRPPTVVYAAR